MKFKLKSKKTLIALAVASAVLLSLGAWAATQVPNQGIVQTVPRENVPTVAYDQGSSEIVIPFVQNGELFLSRVKKPAAGATSTMEISRQSVAKNISNRVVEVNHLTGQYLYETLPTTSPRDRSAVITWLADASGKVVQVLRGGNSKLSPGGTRIAATVPAKDGQDDLKLFDLQGKELASFGSAGYPVFSPDGTKLAFFKMVIGGNDDMGGLTVVDLASGKELATYDPAGRQYTPLAFSEDGNTLFFAADTADTRAADLYALPLLGGAAQIVTKGSSKLPYIAYDSAQYLPQKHLLVLSAYDTVFLVNTQIGSIKIFHNVTDPILSDSSNDFFARTKNGEVVGKTWGSYIAN